MQLHVTPNHIFIASHAGKIDVVFNTYIGKSVVNFRTRMSQHRNYVAKKMLHKATGEHFNKPGHKISDMLMTIIEKVHSDDPMVLSVREEHWIRKGNTKYRGINRNKG